ncbi:unnamed protein product [Cuscuta campestris]|uniref:Uncharacterized protein n=1 Tax=Cuscuta campestris TaxID=132261 RepID=A0A484K8G8_9ASTE|nr:unnamed protein product [Cuscuta campestris]
MESLFQGHSEMFGKNNNGLHKGRVIITKDKKEDPTGFLLLAFQEDSRRNLNLKATMVREKKSKDPQGETPPSSCLSTFPPLKAVGGGGAPCFDPKAAAASSHSISSHLFIPSTPYMSFYLPTIDGRRWRRLPAKPSSVSIPSAHIPVSDPSTRLTSGQCPATRHCNRMSTFLQVQGNSSRRRLPR